MKVNHSIADKIIKKMRASRGEAVSSRDFLDLGGAPAVRQSLSRLARQGKIRRVRRGLYELPRAGKLSGHPVPPSPDALVRAWARENGLRVVPSGASAANLLGLTTQVPARIVYYTNGRTRTVKLGPYTVRFLNRGPRTMDVPGRWAPLVLQALRHLGAESVNEEIIRRLRSSLPRSARLELRNSLRYASAWQKPVLEAIADGKVF